MASGVGHSYPLFAGAAGKAILAFEPQEEQERVLAQPLRLVSTGRAITAAKLRKELITIRAAGYAVSRSETVAGANALAAPVFGFRGVIGSINIARAAPYRGQLVRAVRLLDRSLTRVDRSGDRPLWTVVGLPVGVRARYCR